MTADKSTQGMMMTVFLLFYGASCFFAGPLVQRYGPRLVLGAGLISWAAIMAIMGATSVIMVLLVCRAILGLGEAVLGPSISKFVQTWFPVHERAKANGVWFVGLEVGQIIALPLITWITVAWGWRSSFYALTLMGCLPVIVCMLYGYDSPAKHPRISKEEVEYITGGMQETKVQEKTLGTFAFLKLSSFWYSAVIYAAANAGFWGFMVWVPTYMKTALGFSFAKTGLLSALPYLVGTISVIVLTPLMDKTNARATFSVAGCLGFAITLFMAMSVTDPVIAVAVLCLANVFIMPVFPAVFTIVQNITKPTEVANATGVFNGCAYVFASIFPYAMGALYSSTGNMQNGFYLLASVFALAVLAGIPLVKNRL
ncbi:MFS transporter [Sporomusa acidovorans]|nr:MFS transporter [Sporomusa acidovorans]